MDRMTGIALAALGLVAIVIGFVALHGVGWPHPKSGDLAVLLGVALLITGLVGMSRKAMR
jgi:uncharacterized membrane protein